MSVIFQPAGKMENFFKSIADFDHDPSPAEMQALFASKGYLTGTPDWEPSKEVGTGWQNFRDVIGAANGVIYAFTRTGSILWYRHAKRRPPLPPPQISYLEDLVRELPRLTTVTVSPEATLRQIYELDRNPLISADAFVWEGPVEVKRNFPAYRSVFPLMNPPLRGPN